MTVKFILDCPPYRIDDVAGFPSAKEKWLINKGVAKEMKKPPVDKMVRNAKTKSKEYKCECGRVFDTPQGLGAHKRFCKKAGD